MSDSTGWVSLLPPLIAILLAIRTRQVYISLFVGIWMGWTILTGYNPLMGFIKGVEACVRVFENPSNTKVILFSALVGALITLTQYSGGMEGFVNWVTKKGLGASRRRAGLLAWGIGLIIFVESSISVLVSGAVARPLFDKLRISREKLAYICDSTSAPNCILIPLNAWGAFILGLLSDQGIQNPVKILLISIPLNFYAILAIASVLMVILLPWDIGPMKKAEKRVREEGKLLRDGAEPLISTEVTSILKKDGLPARPVNMIIPIATMVMMMPIGLWITGSGNIMNGSGSTAVFWAVLTSIIVSGILYKSQGIMSLKEIVDQFMKGVGGLIPLASLMILAFAIGGVCRALGTGPYVAGLARSFVSPIFVPVLLFLISCFIAFSTGTSWGTFAIMIPIAVPTIQMMGLHPSLAIAAVLGGGVFGDHCSPISDTTIIASMAAATDHIDHVRTQLPYALIAAGAAAVLYVVFAIIFVSV